LPVFTPEQAAKAPELWLIATDETPASSAARHAALRQLFAVTTHPPRHAGQNTMIWRCAGGNSADLAASDRQCLLTQRMAPAGATRPARLPAIVAIQHQRSR
jgi:hypothetical protein